MSWSASAQINDGATDPQPAPAEDFPAIVSPPRGETVLEGRDVELKVVATGKDLLFQWQREGRILIAATNASLAMSSVGSQQAGRYSVRVYNALGEVISVEATLVVLQPLRIVRQPISLCVTQGSPAVFDLVTAGSAPVRYQWMRYGVDLPGQTNEVLRLESAQAQDSGLFAVRIANAVGEAISDEARLVVLAPPSWSSLPGNRTVREGTPVTLSFQADGTRPFTYQWYRDGNPLEAATGPSLAFDAVRPEDDATYTASVSNQAGREWTPPIRLRVLSPPRIVAGPSSVTVGLSNRVTLSAVVSGSPPLYFGWRRNGIDLFGDPAYVGPDTNILEIPQVTADLAGIYEFVVCNFVGIATADPVEVRVETPPFIIFPPQNQRVALFEELTLNVEAGGSPELTYQWYHNGTAIPSGTDAKLGPIFVQQDSSGPYWVAVKNGAGSVVSDPVYVTVEQPQLTPADQRIDAPTLSLPVGCTIFRGSTTGFTREPDEPLHAGAVGGKSGWYRWRATSSAWVTLGTVGSDFDTVLAVYATGPAGQLVPVANSEDSPGVLTSRLIFKAVPDTDYWIAIDGFDGDNGEVMITAIVEPADADPLPVIISSPASGSGPAGRSTNLVVVAEGRSLTYQWYFLGKPLPGETGSILKLPDIQPRHVGTYFVRVGTSDSAVFVDSERAVIEIGTASDVVSVDKRYFNLPVVGQIGSVPPQLADVSTSAGTIVVRPGASADQIINNESSTWSSSDPRTCNWFGGATRWLTNIVVEKKGILVVDSRDSAVPALTGLFAYVSAKARLLACSQDGLILYTNDTEGAVYDLMADSVQGQGGVISLKFSLIQLPALAPTPPQVRLQELNQALVLDAGVTNNPVPAPTYQWFLNETNLIPNATGRILSLGSFQASDAGLYTVRVRTPIGDITNRVALVSARLPAAWSVESARDIANGGSLGPLWARSATEAYVWVNAQPAGTTGIPEARLFRSASQGWELVLRVPRFRGSLVQGLNESDLTVWLDRADGQTSTGLLLSSADRGASWTTNSLPAGATLPSARALALGQKSLHLLLSDGRLLQRQGTTWSVTVPASQPPLLDVKVADDQHGFAVTRESLWTWNGTRWTEFTKAPAQFIGQKLSVVMQDGQFRPLVLGQDAASGGVRLWNAAAQLAATRIGVGAGVIPLDPMETVLPLVDAVGFGGAQTDRLVVAGRVESGRAAFWEFNGQGWREVAELGELAAPVGFGSVERDELWIPLRDGLMVRRQTLRAASNPQVVIVAPESPLRAGASTELRAEVLGTAPVTYQWQFRGTDLIAQTNSILRLESLSLDLLGVYRVKVIAGGLAGAAETVLSGLQFPPRLLSQAQPIEAFAGSSVEFTVLAEGDQPLSYQWFNDGGIIPGETRETLERAVLQASDAGSYWVEVSNRVGVVRSDRWTLEVRAGFFLSGPSAIRPNLIQGVADAPYVAERSFDLQHWTPWFTNQALRFAAPFSLLDSEAKDAPRQFYRVRSW